MGYELLFEDSGELIPGTRTAYYEYSGALETARRRAARHGRNVVIRLRFSRPFAVVAPDGTVRAVSG